MSIVLVNIYLILKMLLYSYSNSSTNNFDLPLMKEASELFKGCHDFRSFMGTQNPKTAVEKITRKHIEYINIVEGTIPGYCEYSWPLFVGNKDEYLRVDIYIKGSSFLYRQVFKI